MNRVSFHRQCSFVLMLQEGLDSGYFTRQIPLAKVYKATTASCVVAGIPESCRTSFGGYLLVRAGGGKLAGTGGSVLTGGQVVLLSALESTLQQHR